MQTYRLKSLTVNNLWGYKDFSIPLFPDITILIGENGTGKTTLLDLLRSILTVDTLRLSGLRFSRATLRFEAFTGTSIRTLHVIADDDSITYQLSKRKFVLPVVPRDLPSSLLVRHHRPSHDVRLELITALEELVPAIWLPVTRRLPASEPPNNLLASLQTRSPFDRSDQLESVDERLRDVLNELSAFRLRLETKISKLYQDFQRTVLKFILYDASLDSVNAFRASLPSQTDQDQLIQVFRDANLLDRQMTNHIRQHFTRAAEVLDTFENSTPDVNDVLVIPLIRRTQQLVESARTLRHKRDDILSPLKKYQETVNRFLRGKRIALQDDGRLTLRYIDTPQDDAPGLEEVTEQLSSGEKQILILLTALVVKGDTPILYVVDEPELSLHISWQKDLLRSLLELANDLQVVVATHSPDIVGPFRDNIVDLTSDANGK